MVSPKIKIEKSSCFKPLSIKKSILNVLLFFPISGFKIEKNK